MKGLAILILAATGVLGAAIPPNLNDLNVIRPGIGMPGIEAWIKNNKGNQKREANPDIPFRDTMIVAKPGVGFGLEEWIKNNKGNQKREATPDDPFTMTGDPLQGIKAWIENNKGN